MILHRTGYKPYAHEEYFLDKAWFFKKVQKTAFLHKARPFSLFAKSRKSLAIALPHFHEHGIVNDDRIQPKLHATFKALREL